MSCHSATEQVTAPAYEEYNPLTGNGFVEAELLKANTSRANDLNDPEYKPWMNRINRDLDILERRENAYFDEIDRHLGGDDYVDPIYLQQHEGDYYYTTDEGMFFCNEPDTYKISKGFAEFLSREYEKELDARGPSTEHTIPTKRYILT